MQFFVQNKESNYRNVVEKIINTRKHEIFSFFNSYDVEMYFNVYIYDSIESLVKGMKARGFEDMPSYMCACQKDEDNSLNYFEPKDNPGENEYSKKEYETVIFHELVHGIQYNLFGTTPEWINEGIAKYLDGHYSKGIKWLLDNYINNNPIPKQEEIINEFGCHDYDSYDYAYLMVSYLIDTIGKEGLIDLLKNKDKLNNINPNLLNDSIDYYNEKYNDSFAMFYETPLIETDRLILKRGNLDDYLKVYEYDFTKLRDIAGEFEYVKCDPERIKGFVDIEPNSYDWILYLKDTMNPIGNIVADRERADINSIELAYNIHPSYWRCGYAREAIIEVMRYLFSRGYDNIISGYDEGNIKSKSFGEKIGFELFEVHENAWIKNNIPITSYVSILSKEKFNHLYSNKRL